MKTGKKGAAGKAFAQGMGFYKLTWIFVICCVLGFAVETAWYYLRFGYIESRKSLIYGPLSVAYGLGGIILSVTLNRFRHSSKWKIFLVTFVIGTAAEYIFSWGEELFFGHVSWDYSNVPFNINGRVCLLYSVFWGALGLVWVKYVMPVMDRWIEKVPRTLGIVLTWVFIVFFIADVILSASAATRKNARADGILPANKYDQFLDRHYPDERMDKIYANAQKVE